MRHADSLRMLVAVGLCIAPVTAGLWGCRTEPSAVGTPSGLPPSAGCVALYTAYMDYVSRCGLPAPRESPTDLALRCDARAALPGIDVTQTALQGCANQIVAARCGAFPSACLHQAYGAGDYVFPVAASTRSIGQTCDLGEQCASRLCTTGEGPCGVCAIIVKVGQPCGPAALCADYHLACVLGVCVDTGDPVGMACSAPKGDSHCLRNLYCPDSLRVCTPRYKLGEACKSNIDAECPDDARCFGGVCTPFVDVAAGDPCSDVARCPSGTECKDALCYTPRHDIAVGGACIYDTCDAGLVCKLGFCYRPVTNVLVGGDCAHDQCAAGLLCKAGLKCSLPAQEGDACQFPEECAAGLDCRWGVADTAGTCRPPLPLVNEGGVCGDAHCAPGLVCATNEVNGMSTPATCRRQGVAGDPCSVDVACRAPFVCRYPSATGYVRYGTCRVLDACTR